MIIFHIITCLNDGGAEAVLYRLVTADKNNTHIVVSLMDEGKYGALLEREGLQVYTLNMPSGRVTLSGLFQLYKIIRDIKPDVVQTWMYHADLIGGCVSRIAGIKNISWGLHNSNFDSTSKFTTRFVALLCSIMSYFVPKYIISCSFNAARSNQRLGYNKKKFVVINNGYPIDRFTPIMQARSVISNYMPFADNIFLLGMVARYNPQKDHHNLILSFDRLKRRGVLFKCLLVGTGIDEQNNEINALIDENCLTQDVLLLGQRDDIPSIMNALDLHILSSAGEAFPNVIAEAMACGTPCVTTDVGDAALIVGEAGWVVPPRDPQKLADAIIEAIDEKTTKPEKWNQRKINCRKRIVDNFSLEKMVHSYNKVWNEAIKMK